MTITIYFKDRHVEPTSDIACYIIDYKRYCEFTAPSGKYRFSPDEESLDCGLITYPYLFSKWKMDPFGEGHWRNINTIDYIMIKKGE